MISSRSILEAQSLYNQLQKSSHNNYTYVDQSGQFADEPYLFSYACVAKRNKDIVGSSTSIQSPQIAAVKALHEACERASIYEPSRSNSITEATPSSLENSMLPLDSYNWSNKSLQNMTMPLLEVTDIVTQESHYAPSGLIHFSLNKKGQLPLLASTNGTASGFNRERVMLKSMSEVIEYDAILLWYFGLMPGALIDLRSIEDAQVITFLKELSWYKLTIQIVEILSDCSVPIYICFIVDHTGRGPAITCGTGVGLEGTNGIIHAIEEAFQSRFYTKKLMIEAYLKAPHFSFMKDGVPTSKEKRHLYWSDIQLIPYLQKKMTSLDKKIVSVPIKTSVQDLASQYKKKHIHFYMADIAPPSFSKINYQVIKILSPQLQPIYFNEHARKLHVKRFKQRDRNVKMKDIESLIPHPFP